MDRRSSASRMSYATSSCSEVNYASSLVKESAAARQYFDAEDLYLKARMLVAPLLATESSAQMEVKWTDLEKLGDHTMLSWGKLELEKKNRTVVRAVARVPAKLDEVMFLLMCDSTARLTTSLSIFDPTIEQGEVLFTAYPTEHQYDHPNFPLCNVKRTWNSLKKSNKKIEKAKMKEMVFLDFCTIEGDHQSSDRIGIRAMQSLDIPENALPASSTSTPPQSRVQWLERTGFIVRPMEAGWSEITFIGRINPGSSGGRSFKIVGDHKRDLLIVSYLRQFALVVEGISQEIAHSIQKSGSVSKDRGFANEIRCMLNPGHIDEAQTMSSKANKLLGRCGGTVSPTLFNPDAVDQEWLQTIPADNSNQENDHAPVLNLKPTRFQTIQLGDGFSNLLDSVGGNHPKARQQQAEGRNDNITTRRSFQSISSQSSMSSDAIAAALAATDSVSHVSSQVRRTHTQPTFSHDAIYETVDVRGIGVQLSRNDRSDTERIHMSARSESGGSCSGFTRTSEVTVNDMKLEQLERQLEAAKRKADEAEERALAQAKQMERLESKLNQLASSSAGNQIASNTQTGSVHTGSVDDMSDVEAFLNASFAASAGCGGGGDSNGYIAHSQSVGEFGGVASGTMDSIVHSKSVGGVIPPPASVGTVSVRSEQGENIKQLNRQATSDVDAMNEVEAFLKMKYQEAAEGGGNTTLEL